MAERCIHELIETDCADCHPSLDPAIHPSSKFDADQRAGMEDVEA